MRGSTQSVAASQFCLAPKQFRWYPGQRSPFHSVSFVRLKTSFVSAPVNSACFSQSVLTLVELEILRQPETVAEPKPQFPACTPAVELSGQLQFSQLVLFGAL